MKPLTNQGSCETSLGEMSCVSTPLAWATGDVYSSHKEEEQKALVGKEAVHTYSMYNMLDESTALNRHQNGTIA